MKDKQMTKKLLQLNTKMREIEKRYGTDFGEDNTLTLKEFLLKKGYKNLVKLLRINK